MKRYIRMMYIYGKIMKAFKEQAGVENLTPEQKNLVFNGDDDILRGKRRNGKTTAVLIYTLFKCLMACANNGLKSIGQGEYLPSMRTALLSLDPDLAHPENKNVQRQQEKLFLSYFALIKRDIMDSKFTKILSKVGI